MEEKWKDIPNYEGFYQVSGSGMVRSLPRNGTVKEVREIKLNKKRCGYLYLTLHRLNRCKTENVHRLVAKTFIPNPENKPEVNHKNGIKTDNQVSNLEWCTTSENNQHAYDNNLHSQGEKFYNAKLKETQVKEIRSKYIPKKYSTRKLAKEYGVCQATIFEIIKGKNWKRLNS